MALYLHILTSLLWRPKREMSLSFSFCTWETEVWRGQGERASSGIAQPFPLLGSFHPHWLVWMTFITGTLLDLVKVIHETNLGPCWSLSGLCPLTPWGLKSCLAIDSLTQSVGYFNVYGVGTWTNDTQWLWGGKWTKMCFSEVLHSLPLGVRLVVLVGETLEVPGELRSTLIPWK